MRSLLAGVCLLCLTMTAPGQEPSGRVGPLDPSKGLSPVKNGITVRDGIIYASEEAADAAEKESRERQQQARQAAEKQAHLEAAVQALQAEEAKKAEARLWGLGVFGVILAACVLWRLVGRRTGRAAQGTSPL